MNCLSTDFSSQKGVKVRVLYTAFCIFWELYAMSDLFLVANI